MQVDPESLRYILGLKLRKLRQKKGLGLKGMAAKSGLSISYLSEIEKGRKYPKPEKLLALANALGVSFDEIVSLKVDDELGPLTEVFSSPFIQEFPFHLYGIEMDKVLGLVTEAPSRAGALVRTAFEIGHVYDARVEHFLFAALRSYQHMHQNYFEEIEAEVAAFLEEHAGAGDELRSVGYLRQVLQEKHGVETVFQTFESQPSLRGLRSVWIEGERPRLLVNDRLLPSQKAYALARELGYWRLGLSLRSVTSSPIKVESFDQVINDFKAAYFGGAVMIPRDPFKADMSAFFQRKQWSAKAFLELLAKYRSTPETFFYRLSQLLPALIGSTELFFLRFNHRAGSKRFELAKILNMSQLPIIHGLEGNEHYCRRWAEIRLLASAADRLATGAADGIDGDVMATAQRSHFLSHDVEFFIVTLTRPLALVDDAYSSVSLGLLANRTFKRKVRFWNDPAIRQLEVNLTCERCSLSDEECGERAASPVVFEAAEKRRRREEELAQLIEESVG